jgi:2-aminoadipate transaminase
MTDATTDAVTRAGRSEVPRQQSTGSDGIVQFSAKPGVIDLGWGHPDPALLPVELLREATDRTLRTRAADLLAYGAAQGPAPFLESVAEHLGRVDGRSPDPAGVVAAAGASQALDLVATLIATPGDVVIVESPTYHIARKLLVDHGLEPVPVPRGSSGLDLVALEATLDRLRRDGRRVAFLYVIPTFHNPTGSLLSLEQRHALLDLAERHDLRIVEDDAYRELWYEAPPPPSLRSLAEDGRVIQVGSFSKTLAPGLRLGFVVGEPELAGRLAASGLLDSGGGIAHVQALVTAEVMASGEYAAHVVHLRDAYRLRRDALVETLAELVPPGVSVSAPGGGFFAWLTLPAETGPGDGPPDGPSGRATTARDLLPVAEDNGVSFVPGPAFAPEGGQERSLRVSFSRYSPAELSEAARRLAVVFG